MRAYLRLYLTQRGRVLMVHWFGVVWPATGSMWDLRELDGVVLIPLATHKCEGDVAFALFDKPESKLLWADMEQVCLKLGLGEASDDCAIFRQAAILEVHTPIAIKREQI